MNGEAQGELQGIKRLLILLLVKLGATSEEIGEASDMSPRHVRRLFSIAKIKKIAPTER